MSKVLSTVRWLTLGLFSLAAGPFVLTVSSMIYFSTSGTILPDVTVGGVPVGGMTQEEALAYIDQTWNQQYRISAVDIQDSARAWVVSPAEFGLRVDATASASVAAGLLEEGNILKRASRMLTVLRDGYEIQPVVAFDPGQARITYSSWESILGRPARKANIKIDAGQVRIEPSAEGWRLDIPSSIEWIAENPSAMLLEHRMIPFVMRPVSAGRTDVSDVANRVDEILSAPPSLIAYDPVTDEHRHWSPGRLELASWLQINDEGPEVTFSIDRQKVDDFIARSMNELGTERELDPGQARASLLAQLAGNDGELLIIRYQPTKYRVQAGDQWISLGFKVGMPYWKLQDANPDLLRQGLTPGEEIVLPPRDAMFTLPVIPDKRIIVDLSEQRMRVYEQGALLVEHVVSTGIPDSPTMPGIFQISTHELNAYASIWDLYMPHFMGIYDAVPGLTNGIHGLPMLSSGRRLWANVLGRPASFGCIILDLEAAEELYNWAEDGVVVVVQE
jgi:hypothetical protein